MNLSYSHALKDGNRENFVLLEKNCSNFTYRFSKDDYTFGDEGTTFYVYVYDFQSPLWIIISFSQVSKSSSGRFFLRYNFLQTVLETNFIWQIIFPFTLDKGQQVSYIFGPQKDHPLRLSIREGSQNLNKYTASV